MKNICLEGLGGVVIAVLPYVTHPKTAVLGRAGGQRGLPGCCDFLRTFKHRTEYD